MGKFAEKFALRNDPLYLRARELVRVASKYAADSDDEELEKVLLEKMESALETLSAFEFNQMMRGIHQEGAARIDAQDVFDVIETILHSLCESPGAFKSEEAEGQLVAIPIFTTAGHTAWTLQLDLPVRMALAEILKNHGLVVEDAEITFAPRMLMAVEGQHLLHADVYRCAKALRANDLTAVAKVLEDNKERLNLDFSSPAQHVQGSSMGVLMAWVKTEDVEPFPLTMHHFHAIDEVLDLPPEGSEDDEDEAEVDSEEVAVLKQARLEDLEADTNSILQLVGADIAAILGTEYANIPLLTNSWFADLDAILMLERKYIATSILKATAVKHTGGDLSKLCIESDVAPEAGLDGYTLRIHDVASHTLLAKHNWLALDSETSDECLEELAAFLQQSPASMLDRDTGQTEPLSVPRVLH